MSPKPLPIPGRPTSPGGILEAHAGTLAELALALLAEGRTERANGVVLALAALAEITFSDALDLIDAHL